MLLFNEYRVSVLQDGKTLGTGCTIQIYLTLVNSSLKSS